jgi:endonuclease/exonuclease/phosphatase family metal-dependent hydrolase
LPTADLRIVTYNVHRGRGMDRRTRPERIAEVLKDLDADVIAMQEVIGPGLVSAGHAEAFGAALGMGWVMAPARELRRHQFGNVILSRLPIRDHSQHDLSWKSSEPRNSQRVEVEVPHGCVQIFNVHLGTALLERRYQAARLASWVHERRPAGPKIVLGDFNEWLRRGPATAILERRLKSVDLAPYLPKRRSYPGIFPLVHLDHIYHLGEVEIRKVQLVRTRKALIASDHLPLVADVRVSF